MLNSYLVNAAVANGTGTSQTTVSAIAFASSVSFYNRLCTAFRIGAVSSSNSLFLTRFVKPVAYTKQAVSSVLTGRYVYRSFVATVSNVLKVALYVAYTAATVASSVTGYFKYVRSIFTLPVFSAAGKNALDYNPIDGFVMNGFALNDGVTNYKEERVIIGIIVQAITSVAASTVRYVSRFFNTLASNTLKVVKSCQVSFKATVEELQAVIKLARLIEVAVASEAVTYIKFLRVVIATLVAGSSVKAIKMVKLPSQVAAASTKYVSKKCGLIKNTAAYTLNELVRTVGKPIKVTVSNTATAFKLRVVERIVSTVVKVSYIRFMWNYSSVITIVKASRIRLAFLVGVRVLSQWIIGLFRSNTTYVCVNMSTIHVVDKYDPIVVPPEDTEIV
jgi:hypothetical protein